MSDNQESIFAQALEYKSGEDRAEFLDRACANQPVLRREIESLLNAYSKGDFLESPARMKECTLDFPTRQEQPGSKIDRYKLLEQIGEGGMGVVYMAEQTEPVKRRVALKIVKPGMDSHQVLARFEAERQALALMDHPNIAKVHDAGTAKNGRPYFVMELVRGVPITEYCDQAKLTTRQRLELFVAVCHAVVHAHQKGIIHRDLKPSNILVTLHDVVAVPKVIDFGIAKAMSQNLTEKTLFTAFAQMVGTPLYMSPEQAHMSGLDVDTRSDVYSLGVLLYELLTGHTPFDKEQLANAGIDEIRRIIREDEPPRPSLRISTVDAQALSTVAQRRSIDERQLGRSLRGELDWIVMKSLEKDRARRYESASSFAADVQRYLNDEAVQACPPSAVYRLRKFLRRRRQAVSFAAFAFCAVMVLIGVVMSTWYSARRANDARAGRIREALLAANASLEAGSLDQAENRLGQAKALLVEGAPIAQLASQVVKIDADIGARRKDQRDLELFRSLAEKGLQDGMGATDLENLDQSATKALALFGVLKNDQWLADLRRRHFTPAAQKEIQETAYITLLFLADHEVRWKWDDAQRAAHSQEFLNRAATFHEPTRAFHFVQAQVHRILGNNAAANDADARFRAAAALSAWDYFLPGHTAGWKGDLPEAIRSYEAALRIQPDHYPSLYFLALRLIAADRRAEGMRIYAACMAVRPNDPNPLIQRGNGYCRLGDIQAAEADYTRAIELATTDVQRIDALSARSGLYMVTGQEQKALRDDEQLIPIRESILQARQTEFGANAIETLTAMNELGNGYRDVNRADKAIPLLEKASAELLQQFGDRNPNTLNALYYLASTHDVEGRLEKAEALYEQALEGRRVVLGTDHKDTQDTMYLLAKVYSGLGRHDKAIALASELADLRRSKLGLDALDTLDIVDVLCTIKSTAGQNAEAIQIREEHEAGRVKLGASHPIALRMANNLGSAYLGAGKIESAIEVFEKMLPAQEAVFGRDDNRTLVSMFSLSVAYERAGRLDDAIPLKEEILARRTATLGREHPQTMRHLEDLGLTYVRLAKKPEKAIPLRLEWLALKRKQLNDESEFAGLQASVAADLLLDLGAYAEAEPILRECLATRTRLHPDEWNTFNAQSMLGGALAGLKRLDEAEPLLLSGYQGMKERQQQIPIDGKFHLQQAAERLAQLYEAMGQADKAAHWREIAVAEQPSD